ncbi:MAG: DUF4474 domain-containing protein, partial [Clostridiales bacterium]|nr:DUF4474 domain-containing protein [Clostridiales bacterium]
TPTPTATPSPTNTPTNTPTPIPDDDEDGLPNFLEEFAGLDTESDDTDKDGLDDLYEIRTTKTDPRSADSDGDGTPDGEEDFDSDGLSNLREFQLGTNPSSSDSDKDGLTDYDEVEIHHSNPLKADTDDDGLSDLDETILGLDPTKSKTDGITFDNERTFEQTLSDELFDDSLFSPDRLLVPSLSGSVSGPIDKHVTVQAGTDIYDDNRAVVGKPIEIASDLESDDTFVLTFTCTSLIDKPAEYVNNIVIFEVTGDDITPLETTVAGNTISAEVKANGVYMAIDVDEFLKALGIDILAGDVPKIPELASVNGSSAKTPSEHSSSNYQTSSNTRTQAPSALQAPSSTQAPSATQVPSASATAKSSGTAKDIAPGSAAKTTVNEAPVVTAQGWADITFVIDSTGSMGDEISNVELNVNLFAQKLVEEYNVNANFALIDYKDVLSDGWDTTVVHKYNSSNWFSRVKPFQDAVRTIGASGGGDEPESVIDALETARQLDYRSNAKKFVILVTDASYRLENRYEITSMAEMISMLDTDEITVSVVGTASHQTIYEDLYEITDGIYADIYGNFADELLTLASKIGEIVNEKKWVVLDDFQVMQIDDEAEADTDGDGISDVDEIGDETKEVNMTYMIMLACLSKGVDPALYLGKTTIEVSVYKSNPLKQDTDGDGLLDGSATYVSGKKTAPKDSEPRVANGPTGIWKKQIEVATAGGVETDYGMSPIDKYIADLEKDMGNAISSLNPANAILAIKDMIILIYNDLGGFMENSTGFAGGLIGCVTINPAETASNVATFLKNNLTEYIRKSPLEIGVDSREAAAAGATILGFTYDAAGTALHSDPDNWQKIFGYNNVYDYIFALGTDMRKIQFFDEANEYVIWAWRGDYMNLGAGAEIGLYKRNAAGSGDMGAGIKNIFESVTSADHYAVDTALPMTLNLYNYHSAASIEPVFNWAPKEDQWWITGFNPEFDNPSTADMVVLGSVDFSSRTDVYESMKKETLKEASLKKHVVFDDEDSIMWLVWGK